ncbi:alpha-(1,3)-fucosyltransferase 10 [Cloeon dipterum]|uniref:alpha-(1,3)-fucosyltransferase 10 n=1 Tax=Cloeon dipterum TaxID=197152 RepID=UPI0032202AC4
MSCFSVFLTFKIKHFLALVTLLSLALLILNLTSFRRFSSEINAVEFDVQIPTILWWTPFTGENGVLKNCDLGDDFQASCFFTNERKLYQQTKALLFYGSSFNAWELPPRNPKRKRPLWALLHEESPRNTALLQHESALSLFNFSATFSRHSDLPLTLQHLTSLEDLVGHEFLQSWQSKVQFQKKEGLAPVVFIQSDCDTSTDRDSYVRELMKYVKVDSYGSCLQNKMLPESIRDPMSALHSDEFWRFQSKYKFSIAFENGECLDYITEKLWRPLVIGSVPIYYGSPTFQDWLPFKNSTIDVRDYKSPKELAEFILMLDSDEERYNQFLEHKRQSPERFSSELLLHMLAERKWSVGEKLWNNFETKSLVEVFECYVCQRVHENLKEGESVVKLNHYECPPPVSALTKTTLNNSFWFEQWHQGQFEAQLVKELVETGKVVTQDEFYEIVGQRMVAKRKKKK